MIFVKPKAFFWRIFNTLLAVNKILCDFLVNYELFMKLNNFYIKRYNDKFLFVFVISLLNNDNFFIVLGFLLSFHLLMFSIVMQR